MGLRLILDSMEGGYVYLFQAHQEMGPYALVNILGAAIRLVGIILVVSAGAQIVGAGSIWVLASAVALLVMMFLGHKRGWKPGLKEYRLNDSWNVLKMAFPLATFGALQTLYYRVDSVILKSFSGNEAVGFYDMATRVLLFALALSQLYSQAVYPVFSSVQDKPRDFGRLAFKCVKFLFFLGLPMTVGGYFLAGPLLVLIAGPQYVPSGPAFAVLALSILPFFIANIYVDILAVKNTARLNFQFILLFFPERGPEFYPYPSLAIRGGGLGNGYLRIFGCIPGVCPGGALPETNGEGFVAETSVGFFGGQFGHGIGALLFTPSLLACLGTDCLCYRPLFVQSS